MVPRTAPEVIDGLEEVWASMLEATEGLEEAQWATPTACPGWDVRDQLSHLIGIERSLMGDAPPAIELGETSHLRNPIGEMNELWVEERRGRSGDDVRTEFADVTQRRLAELRSYSEERFDEVGWSPIGQVPLRIFMLVRIMDSWMHEQDAREALGRSGGRGGIGETVAISRADAALGLAIGKGAGATEGQSVAIDIVGDLGGRRRLEVIDGRAVSVEGPEATASITMSEETYVRRFGGRITSDEARLRDGTVLEGDIDLAGRVIDSLAVMI
jgi:hypothetical protein